MMADSKIHNPSYLEIDFSYLLKGKSFKGCKGLANLRRANVHKLQVEAIHCKTCRRQGHANKIADD